MGGLLQKTIRSPVTCIYSQGPLSETYHLSKIWVRERTLAMSKLDWLYVLGFPPAPLVGQTTAPIRIQRLLKSKGFRKKWVDAGHLHCERPA